MNKFFVGSMVVSLLSLAALAEEAPEEVIEGGGGQEPAAPERYTATILPGGTKTYTNPEHWDTGKVPDGYHVDVVIDNDPTQNTTVNFLVGENTSYTNGTLIVDAGDSITYKINDSKGTSGHNWWMTSITNRGSFIIDGRIGKNDQSATVHAEDAPLYNAQGAVLKIQNTIGGYRGSHYLRVPLDGSVNKGEIEISGGSARASNSQLNFLGAEGGVFLNEGTVLVRPSGTYTQSNVGSVGISFPGPTILRGNGSIWLDNDRKAPNGSVIAKLTGPGMTTPLVIGEGQTIKGDGLIDQFYLHNYGVIRSEGSNSVMKIQMTSWRNTECVVTNEVSGCIIANSSRGILLNTRVPGDVGERPDWNARFINLGLLESRTGSQIRFCNGINTTSTKTGDGNLDRFDTDYLELWGRIAGGGQFVTPRRIYIGDGARLMPGDLANTDGTGESTCGTITFPRLVLREPAAIPDSEETTSGAITEFQCRKPEAGKYDSVWVNGDATVAGTLRFLRQPKAGTYPLFTSTGTLTCDLSALKIDLADGVKAPKLRLNTAATYTVEEPVLDEVSGEPVLDEETGLPKTQTVEMPCQRLEATWVGGFTVFVR